MTLPTPQNEAEKLFLSHVTETPPPADSKLHSPCWKWTASCDGAGRPQFNQRNGSQQKNTTAARWAFEHFKHPLSAGKTVNHLCDNHLCVSPDHLVDGTQQENMQDCIAKGRHTTGKPLTKLNKAVELSANGSSLNDIADALNIPTYEVERLLEFNIEDASLYEIEKASFGHDIATDLRQYRLVAGYKDIVAVEELLNLARHIKQLELSV